MTLTIIGVVIVSPILCLPFCEDDMVMSWGFIGPGALVAGIGWTLSRLCADSEPMDITYREGVVVIVLSWTMAVLFGAVPFMLITKLNFAQAFFEATSGWTTTGLSVVDVTAVPYCILLYRSVLQFVGGAGFAIIMLSALAGPAGTALTTGEGREGQLAPNIKKSAKLVLSMYAGYAVMGTLGLRAAGMDWFDAINHAFTAVSTGGFSTRAESIGYWNSPAVEGVTVALMLLGSTNFVTAHMLLKRQFRFLWRNGELRLQLALLLVFLPILFFGVTNGLYPVLHKGLRVAIFEAVSGLSTTGFSTVSYESWGAVGWLVLLVLMLIGGGTGSTAGGLKQFRIYVLYRGLLWEFKRRILPQNVVTETHVWHGEQRRFITDEDLRRAGLFMFLYAVVFILGAMLISSYGYPLKESLFEFASTLGTVGLSAGITGPETPSVILWSQMAGMLLGRLEFFAIILGTIKLVQDVLAMTALEGLHLM
jgi:trk system potassium uptake protein TrkH